MCENPGPDPRAIPHARKDVRVLTRSRSVESNCCNPEMFYLHSTQQCMYIHFNAHKNIFLLGHQQRVFFPHLDALQVKICEVETKSMKTNLLLNCESGGGAERRRFFRSVKVACSNPPAFLTNPGPKPGFSQTAGGTRRGPLVGDEPGRTSVARKAAEIRAMGASACLGSERRCAQSLLLAWITMSGD